MVARCDSGVSTFPQVLEVPERDQASQEPDPMAGVLCMHCGSGDDDDLLLLCDGAISAPLYSLLQLHICFSLHVSYGSAASRMLWPCPHLVSIRRSQGLQVCCCHLRRLRPGDAHVLRGAHGGAGGRLALPRVRRGGGGACRQQPPSQRLGAGGAGRQRR